MDELQLQIKDPFQENSAAKEAFLSYCHSRRFPAKHPIIRPGDMADTLHFIIEGQVTVSVEDDEGHELILAYLNAGEFIGEMGIFMPQERREVLVQTRTPCELAQVSYSRLEQLLARELKDQGPFLLYSIGSQLTHRLLQTSRKVRRLAFMDVTGRIARTLIDLAKMPDAVVHPEGMQIKISRQEISRIVGCSREMAGRVLKSLEEEGMITARGKTIVIFSSELT